MYKNFPQKQIESAKMSKAELAQLIGLNKSNISYDYALPQEWLLSFIDNTGFNYDLVRSTCFVVYSIKQLFGSVISGCTEIQLELDKL